MASGEYEGYYAVIRRVPAGRVVTYGDVAERAGRPRSARRVGYALSCLDEHRPGPKVPWWRVINARGEISPRTWSGAPDDWQRVLLAREGVRFDAEGRVDLARYRHVPRQRTTAAAPPAAAPPATAPPEKAPRARSKALAK